MRLLVRPFQAGRVIVMERSDRRVWSAKPIDYTKKPAHRDVSAFEGSITVRFSTASCAADHNGELA